MLRFWNRKSHSFDAVFRSAQTAGALPWHRPRHSTAATAMGAAAHNLAFWNHWKLIVGAPCLQASYMTSCTSPCDRTITMIFSSMYLWGASAMPPNWTISQAFLGFFLLSLAALGLGSAFRLGVDFVKSPRLDTASARESILVCTESSSAWANASHRVKVDDLFYGSWVLVMMTSNGD